MHAAAPWKDRGPEQWSAEDLDALLIDSPWARPAEVAFTGDRGDGSLPGSGGGTPRSRLPGGIPGGGWPGRYAFDSEAPVVRWETALPIRQALALRRQDSSMLAPDPDHYSVVLTGLPFGAAPMVEHPERILAGCALARKGRRQIRPRRLEILPRPGAPGVRFVFPREPAVSVDDKTFEFLLALDDYQVSRQFKLKEMVYKGRLEL